MLSGGQNAWPARREPLVVDAVQPVRVDVPLEALLVVTVCASIITPRCENMTL
jgi:hypothetical protein